MARTRKILVLFLVISVLIFLFRTNTDPVISAPTSAELQKYVLEVPHVTSPNDDIVTKVRLQIDQLISSNNHKLVSARLWGTTNQLLWGRGRAVAAISQTIPYLTTSEISSIKTYLDTEVTQNLLSQNYISTKEVSGSLGKDGTDSVYGISWSGNSAFCWEALYGLWSYGYYTGSWTTLQTNWSTIKTIYSSCAQNSIRVLQPVGEPQTISGINSEIAGNIGMARLAKQFNDTTTYNTSLTRATTLLGQKIDQVAASSNNPVVLKGAGGLGRFLSIDIYQDLTPEVARAIKDYQKPKVVTQMSAITNRFRTWYLSDLDHVSDWMSVSPFPPVDDASSRPGEEGYQMSMFATPIFISRAYITEEPVATLRKELPLAITSRENDWATDIFRLQHLVSLLHRTNGVSWSQ